MSAVLNPLAVDVANFMFATFLTLVIAGLAAFTALLYWLIGD